MRYIIKNSETDYTIKCDENGQGGYNVVPRDIDPFNLYTIEEVQEYLQENPETLLDVDAIKAKSQRIEEIAQLKNFLTETDYIYPKCLELGLDVNIEYESIVQDRKTARARIQALRDVPQQAGFPHNITWPQLDDEHTGGDTV